MPLDGIAVSCLAAELAGALCGASIQKIYQPEKDELMLLVHAGGKSQKLLLSANPQSPRVHFTQEARENPASPPMFCMLLRKHLAGGKITGVRQVGFERMIEITLESYTEMGDLTEKKLVCELMGRQSNIIFVDDKGVIIDSIRHVDMTVSRLRMVLPGLLYEQAPSQNKQNPLQADEPRVLEALGSLAGGVAAENAFVELFTGISPLAGREIAAGSGVLGLRMQEVGFSQMQEMARQFVAFFETVKCGAFSPCLLYPGAGGPPKDFWAFPITQYDGLAKARQMPSLGEAMESYYAQRAQSERMKQKSHSLQKLLSNHLQRCQKKLVIQQKTLKDSQKKEQYKQYGDLVTANLYAIKFGDKSVVVQNYYEPDSPETVIALDERLSPAQNAQRYYSRYNKAKTAEKMAAEQMEKNLEEIRYLESVLLAVQGCKTGADLEEIRAELMAAGYLAPPAAKKGKGPKKAKAPAAKPLAMEFEGYEIYIGRNNLQNDFLTLKMGRAQDMWLHIKDLPGSHVLIKFKGEPFPDAVVEFAARQAARFSKAAPGVKAAVDYTQVKNVKKPSGAKPGMVIYEGYNTAYVLPAGEDKH